MRILAFSDVVAWDPFQNLVDRWHPDVVALAGDLTSDGGAAFWHTALEVIPAFRREITALREQLGVRTHPAAGYEIVPRRSHDEYTTRCWELESLHRDSLAFRRARKRIHVTKFYSFLRYAGARATVLVIKGDHDDDFAGDYVPRKINAIAGCHEISSRIHSVDGIVFLGLGFEQAGYRRPLRRIVAEHRGKADVVLAHGPQNNIAIVAELQPRLLIRGHSGRGTHTVGTVPSVFTAGCYATLIAIRRDGPARISILR